MTKRKLIKNSCREIKILVVEDDELSQLVMASLLTQSGHSFDIAGNGSEALKLIHANAYQLILMDIGLPDISGTELAMRIRKHSPNVCAPIIALTAHRDTHMKDECLQSGMDDFISKPLEYTQLKRLLRTYIHM